MSSPRAKALGRLPYFAGLDRDTLMRLAAEARERRCAAGELVLAEGEPCRGLSFVVHGRVKAFKLAPDGREQVLRILGPGRTFNDVPLFDGAPNPASVAALEEATVVGLLPEPQLQTIIEEHPEVAAAVIGVLARRLRAVTEMVEDLALRGVGARVARLLLECSRGTPLLAEGAVEDHCMHLTQQQIAAMTGTVREVVQRALKALEREGAVALARGRIRVLAPEVLEAWSGAGRGES
jgi:CRP/FNR family transcriptional regulator